MLKLVPIECRSVAVFAAPRPQIRTAVGKALRSARTALREALRPAPLLIGFMHDIFRTCDELLGEIAALPQWLVVASRGAKQPIFFRRDRGPMMILASDLPNWQSAVQSVEPETVLRWHR